MAHNPDSKEITVRDNDFGDLSVGYDSQDGVYMYIADRRGLFQYAEAVNLSDEELQATINALITVHEHQKKVRNGTTE